MVCNKYAESLFVEPTQKQLEHAKADINETEGKLEHNETLLAEWIKCQPHFPKHIEKCYIRSFLRGSKHNLDSAKRRIEYHLTARSLYPEIYSSRTPFSKDIAQIMDVVSIAISPVLTEKGVRMAFFKVEDPDPSKFDPLAASKLFLMAYEYCMTADMPIGGEMAIFDCSNFSANHYLKFAGPSLKLLVALLRQAYAIRLRQIHILNAPAMLEKFLSIVKPLLHIKVRNSIVVHKDLTSCTEECFCPEVMPSNYGGKLQTVREIAHNTYKALSENAAFFEKQEDMKTTGPINKKIESTLYFKEQLGVEGSFRKLQID